MDICQPLTAMRYLEEVFLRFGLTHRVDWQQPQMALYTHIEVFVILKVEK